MSTLRMWLARARGFVGGHARFDAALAEEMNAHVDLETEELVRRGMDRAAARRQALLHAGGIEGAKEACRDQRGVPMMDGIVRDASYALRSLRRAPLLAAVVVCSLAIVIGVATCVFAVVDGLYLRRLPLPHPEQLVTVAQGGHGVIVPYEDLHALLGAPGVPALAAYRFEPAEVAVDGAPESTPEWIDLVSGGYFDLLGVPPMLGRPLTADDERRRSFVAVVSDRFRRAHFAAGVDPVGHTVTLNDLTLTVIGVMPPSFQGIHFARQFEIAAPITLSPVGFPDVSQFGVDLIGRVPDGSRGSAAAAMRVALEHCCIPASSSGGAGSDATRALAVFDATTGDGPYGSAGQWMDARRNAGPLTLGDASRGLRWGVDYRARYARLVVMGLVAALLLVIVGCANVATLLAARGEQREREFAIRLSLGASRRRLARQLLIEAGELTIAGGLLGFALAIGLSRWVVRVLGLSSDAGHGALVDWRSAPVLLLPAALVLLCAVLVTLWPARRAGRANLLPAIVGTSRRGILGVSFERLLVLVQGATAVVLASTALVFVATVAELTHADGGYRSRDIVLARIGIRDALCDGSSYVAARDRCDHASGQSAYRLARFDDVIGALERIPGVASAGLTVSAPVIQDMMLLASLRLGDEAGAPQGTRVSVVGAGFFTATGIGLVAGRDFRPTDDAAGARVAIVSQSTARRYYPRGSAIGRMIVEQTRSGLEPVRIVGVANDAKFDPMTSLTSDLRGDGMQMVYFPVAQGHVMPNATLVIRTASDPARVQPAIDALLRHYPGISVQQVVSLDRLLDQGSARERLSAALFTGAGGVSLALVAIALFAVLQYAVQRRTRELGIRLALGARRGDVLALVMRDALASGVWAVMLGLPVAIAVQRVVRAQLFGIAPGDPRVLAGVAGVVVTLAVAAGLLPALRAAAVDPLDAIRVD